MPTEEIYRIMVQEQLELVNGQRLQPPPEHQSCRTMRRRQWASSISDSLIKKDLAGN